MNKKSVIGIVLGVIVVCAAAYAAWAYYRRPHFDPANMAYTVEGQSVALAGGRAEVPAAPGSAAKTVTTLFGQPAYGDLNGDGRADAAVILMQESGGSGTFYYVAAAVTTNDGVKGTNAILLGDRVSPRSIEVKDGKILANYVDRKPGEPMAAEPSVAVNMYLAVDGTSLKATFVSAGPQQQ